MANYLKMSKRQQVIALLDLGWTYRRIEAETGVRRETVSRYDRWRRSNAAKVFPDSGPPASLGDPVAMEPDGSNPAKVFAGSPSNAAKAFPGSALPERSTAAPFREAILEKLGQDLSLIAALPHVDFVSAGYNSGTHFDWFRHAASLVRKRWGTIVQLCTYGKREGTPPDTIRQTFRTAVEAGASLLHVYAGVNFFTRRKDPLDTGLYYMPEQVKAWQESVEWLRARPRP